MTPQTPEELAEALRCTASRGGAIALGGAFSKNAMAGPLAPADAVITTAGMRRVLQYDPRDLTISVEAGMPYRELERVLAANRQMVPLDPPFVDTATVGGVVASDGSGPRRRLYGTARDLVIGMKFATLEGSLVQSGGMVVKNVAGLDMAKLMVGSFGTLAGIAVVNFKVQPMPAETRTFLLEPDARKQILNSVLQPAAIDMLNQQAAARLALPGPVLLVQAGGNAAVIERYGREFGSAGVVEGSKEEALWRAVQDFTPGFLAEEPEGAVVRVSCLSAQVDAVLEALPGPAVARGGTGVVYGYFSDWRQAGDWVRAAVWPVVIEFAPPDGKSELELWPRPGNALALMRQVKNMFDPDNLLNRGRLYGRI